MDLKTQEEMIRQIATYSPLSVHAVNKEMDFIPQKSQVLRLKETSVTHNHWSVRAVSTLTFMDL